MIKPTVGRIVWFTPIGIAHMQQPYAAIVCHVWSDRCVNLAVFDQNGNVEQHTSVTLLQDADERPESGRYCEWMPYQKGQAAKVDAVSKRAFNPDDSVFCYLMKFATVFANINVEASGRVNAAAKLLAMSLRDCMNMDALQCIDDERVEVEASQSLPDSIVEIKD